MEFSAEWLASLAVIILIDLLLAGDNAVVIALAARKLPAHLQKRAVLAGTAGAIVVRVIMVFFALRLLAVPGLSAGGGLVLYWIAWRLLRKEVAADDSPAADTFWAAMRTIIIADTVMGLDNILAIAGASRGDLWLVIFGFALSIPIMVGCSLLILKLLKKAPWLIIVGCALLALIAGRMILDDHWVSEQMSNTGFSAISEWLIIAATAGLFTSVTMHRTKAADNGGIS